MEKSTLALIGTVDTLIYLLKTDKKARKSKDARMPLKRLERIRDELVAEGLRYSQRLGTARACIAEVSSELQSLLSRRQDVQGVLQGLASVAAKDIEPPPLPSSSSSGPKAIGPGARRLARTVMRFASTRPGAAARSIRPIV